MKQTKKSTFKLLFYLKKNELKKNGLAALMGRITVDGKATSFSTKLEIDPNAWDLKHGRVIGKSLQAQGINTKLDKIRSRIDSHYDEILKEEGFVTTQKLKSAFLGINVDESTLLSLLEEHNTEFKKLVDKGQYSYSTYKKYVAVYNHLSKFIQLQYFQSDIHFRELTLDFIREFDAYLQEKKGCTHNTVWIYTLPVLRMVKLAIKKGLIRKDPFDDYKISKNEKSRGYLLKKDIEKLMTHTLEHKRYELVRDLFVFSCFTGLAYIDIKKLKQSHIQSFFDGHQWIISRRQKSDVESNVRLLEVPKKIIEKYAGIGRNDFIFPMPCNSTCNKYIRKIATHAEVFSENKISFHTARHTFGTMFLTEGIPLESLSKMMGHKNIATTQIYAKITSQKISQDMDLIADKFKTIESVF